MRVGLSSRVGRFVLGSRRPLTVLMLGACLAFSQISNATTVLPMSLDQLLGKSPLVVYGKVVQIEVESVTGYRTAIVESLDTARAPEEFKSQREFYVPLHDRAIPHSEIIEKISSAPQLKLGEEVLLFLRPIAVAHEGLRHRKDGRRIFSLDGFHQGKFRIFEDKQGVRRVLAWDELPESEPTFEELRAQKTTARQSKALRPQLDRPAARSLDAVLSSARQASVSSNGQGDQ